MGPASVRGRPEADHLTLREPGGQLDRRHDDGWRGVRNWPGRGVKRQPYHTSAVDCSQRLAGSAASPGTATSGAGSVACEVGPAPSAWACGNRRTEAEARGTTAGSAPSASPAPRPTAQRSHGRANLRCRDSGLATRCACESFPLRISVGLSLLCRADAARAVIRSMPSCLGSDFVALFDVESPASFSVCGMHDAGERQRLATRPATKPFSTLLLQISQPKGLTSAELRSR
jgi:hypothetical protein